MGRSATARRDTPARARSTWAAGHLWIEVSVLTSGACAEAASAILDDLRTGGLIEERVNGTSRVPHVRLRCYLPPSRLLPVTLRTLRTRIRALARFGLDPGPARVTSRPVPARRWARAWRGHVRPVRVGRLLVRPSWIRVPVRPGAVALTIDPGMAFGTGLHPSTRLCLRALLRYLPTREGAAVFDVGTGSGILAIAAARLAAPRVWAVDSDPVAVAVARVNARLNGVARRVRVVQGTGVVRAEGRAGLILANLIAETIVSLLPTIRRRLLPGGVFVGSGIIAGRLTAVLRAAKAAGLMRLRVLAEGEWRAVVLSPRPRTHLQTSGNGVH